MIVLDFTSTIYPKDTFLQCTDIFSEKAFTLCDTENKSQLEGLDHFLFNRIGKWFVERKMKMYVARVIRRGTVCRVW
jgi:hypothetical protein